ncbi:hypothetical protein KJ966_22315 [bacterium]|nr:hypothetical protein [bacterium]
MRLDQIKTPIPIAHRGYNIHYPENTLASIGAAIKNGAQVVEFDVSFSKDRQLIVIHDETLDRTTNGTGKISDFTFDQLRALDAGSWFDPKFQSEKLPTLDEILDLVGNNAVINIEIKEEYYEEDGQPDSIEQKVLKTVREKNLMDSVLISSFEIRYLERLSKQKTIPALAFISRKPADLSVVKRCVELGLYSWNPWHSVLTKEQVEAMHSAGIKVFTFTVNEIEEYKNLLNIGVDGVFSDDFLKLKNALG